MVVQELKPSVDDNQQVISSSTEGTGVDKLDDGGFETPTSTTFPSHHHHHHVPCSPEYIHHLLNFFNQVRNYRHQRQLTLSAKLSKSANLLAQLPSEGIDLPFSASFGTIVYHKRKDLLNNNNSSNSNSTEAKCNFTDAVMAIYASRLRPMLKEDGPSPTNMSICCIVFHQQMQQLEAFTVASKEAEENLVVITEEELSKTVNSTLIFADEVLSFDSKATTVNISTSKPLSASDESTHNNNNDTAELLELLFSPSSPPTLPPPITAKTIFQLMYDLLFEISFTTDLLVEFHNADIKLFGSIVRNDSCSLRKLLQKEFLMAKSYSQLKSVMVDRVTEVNRLWTNVLENFDLVAQAIVKFSDDFEAMTGANLTTTTPSPANLNACSFDWEPKEEVSEGSAKSRLLVSLIELRRLKNGLIRLLFGMSIGRFNRFVAKNSQVIGFHKFC
ncbi:hypothetical protein TYRP_001580 [Tyrophagus putrescentiae]|nr:hypothetical protein TYRP_001580 [Tyrophagus putrescentiae]